MELGPSPAHEAAPPAPSPGRERSSTARPGSLRHCPTFARAIAHREDQVSKLTEVAAATSERGPRVAATVAAVEPALRPASWSASPTPGPCPAHSHPGPP